MTSLITAVFGRSKSHDRASIQRKESSGSPIVHSPTFDTGSSAPNSTDGAPSVSVIAGASTSSAPTVLASSGNNNGVDSQLAATNRSYSGGDRGQNSAGRNTSPTRLSQSTSSSQPQPGSPLFASSFGAGSTAGRTLTQLLGVLNSNINSGNSSSAAPGASIGTPEELARAYTCRFLECREMVMSLAPGSASSPIRASAPAETASSLEEDVSERLRLLSAVALMAVDLGEGMTSHIERFGLVQQQQALTIATLQQEKQKLEQQLQEAKQKTTTTQQSSGATPPLFTDMDGRVITVVDCTDRRDGCSSPGAADSPAQGSLSPVATGLHRVNTCSPPLQRCDTCAPVLGHATSEPSPETAVSSASTTTTAAAHPTPSELARSAGLVLDNTSPSGSQAAIQSSTTVPKLHRVKVKERLLSFDSFSDHNDTDENNEGGRANNEENTYSEPPPLISSDAVRRATAAHQPSHSRHLPSFDHNSSTGEQPPRLPAYTSTLAYHSTSTVLSPNQQEQCRRTMSDSKGGAQPTSSNSNTGRNSNADGGGAGSGLDDYDDGRVPNSSFFAASFLASSFANNGLKSPPGDGGRNAPYNNSLSAAGLRSPLSVSVSVCSTGGMPRLGMMGSSSMIPGGSASATVPPSHSGVCAAPTTGSPTGCGVRKIQNSSVPRPSQLQLVEPTVLSVPGSDTPSPSLSSPLAPVPLTHLDRYVPPPVSNLLHRPSYCEAPSNRGRPRGMHSFEPSSNNNGNINYNNNGKSDFPLSAGPSLPRDGSTSHFSTTSSAFNSTVRSNLGMPPLSPRLHSVQQGAGGTYGYFSSSNNNNNGNSSPSFLNLNGSYCGSSPQHTGRAMTSARERSISVCYYDAADPRAMWDQQQQLLQQVRQYNKLHGRERTGTNPPMSNSNVVNSNNNNNLAATGSSNYNGSSSAMVNNNSFTQQSLFNVLNPSSGGGHRSMMMSPTTAGMSLSLCGGPVGVPVVTLQGNGGDFGGACGTVDDGLFDMLNEYTILDELGKGATAVVYLLFDTKKERFAAGKRMNFSRIKWKREVERIKAINRNRKRRSIDFLSQMASSSTMKEAAAAPVTATTAATTTTTTTTTAPTTASATTPDITATDKSVSPQSRTGLTERHTEGKSSESGGDDDRNVIVKLVPVDSPKNYRSRNPSTGPGANGANTSDLSEGHRQLTPVTDGATHFPPPTGPGGIDLVGFASLNSATGWGTGSNQNNNPVKSPALSYSFSANQAHHGSDNNNNANTDGGDASSKEKTTDNNKTETTTDSHTNGAESHNKTVELTVFPTMSLPVLAATTSSNNNDTTDKPLGAVCANTMTSETETTIAANQNNQNSSSNNKNNTTATAPNANANNENTDKSGQPASRTQTGGLLTSPVLTSPLDDDPLPPSAYIHPIEREYKLLQTLHHPNITELYAVIEDADEEVLYLIMTYVPHGPVTKVVVPAYRYHYGPEQELVYRTRHPSLCTTSMNSSIRKSVTVNRSSINNNNTNTDNNTNNKTASPPTRGARPLSISSSDEEPPPLRPSRERQLLRQPSRTSSSSSSDAAKHEKSPHSPPSNNKNNSSSSPNQNEHTAERRSSSSNRTGKTSPSPITVAASVDNNNTTDNNNSINNRNSKSGSGSPASPMKQDRASLAAENDGDGYLQLRLDPTRFHCLPALRPLSKALAICSSVIAAVYYLHVFKHVVHRDIKPDNILMDYTDPQEQKTSGDQQSPKGGTRSGQGKENEKPDGDNNNNSDDTPVVRKKHWGKPYLTDFGQSDRFHSHTLLPAKVAEAVARAAASNNNNNVDAARQEELKRASIDNAEFSVLHMGKPTAAAGLAGTPAFMPPEAVNATGGSSNFLLGGSAQQQEPSCHPSTDIWALGVTIYGLVFGVLPFAAGMDYSAGMHNFGHNGLSNGEHEGEEGDAPITGNTKSLLDDITEGALGFPPSCFCKTCIAKKKYSAATIYHYTHPDGMYTAAVPVNKDPDGHDENDIQLLKWFKHLLSNMLKKDPNQRWSIRRVLQHPLFRRGVYKLRIRDNIPNNNDNNTTINTESCSGDNNTNNGNIKEVDEYDFIIPRCPYPLAWRQSQQKAKGTVNNNSSSNNKNCDNKDVSNSNDNNNNNNKKFTTTNTTRRRPVLRSSNASRNSTNIITKNKHIDPNNNTTNELNNSNNNTTSSTTTTTPRHADPYNNTVSPTDSLAGRYRSDTVGVVTAALDMLHETGVDAAAAREEVRKEKERQQQQQKQQERKETDINKKHDTKEKDKAGHTSSDSSDYGSGHEEKQQPHFADTRKPSLENVSKQDGVTNNNNDNDNDILQAVETVYYDGEDVDEDSDAGDGKEGEVNANFIKMSGGDAFLQLSQRDTVQVSSARSMGSSSQYRQHNPNHIHCSGSGSNSYSGQQPQQQQVQQQAQSTPTTSPTTTTPTTPTTTTPPTSTAASPKHTTSPTTATTTTTRPNIPALRPLPLSSTNINNSTNNNTDEAGTPPITTRDHTRIAFFNKSMQDKIRERRNTIMFAAPPSPREHLPGDLVINNSNNSYTTDREQSYSAGLSARVSHNNTGNINNNSSSDPALNATTAPVHAAEMLANEMSMLRLHNNLNNNNNNNNSNTNNSTSIPPEEILAPFSARGSFPLMESRARQRSVMILQKRASGEQQQQQQQYYNALQLTPGRHSSRLSGEHAAAVVAAAKSYNNKQNSNNNDNAPLPLASFNSPYNNSTSTTNGNESNKNNRNNSGRSSGAYYQQLGDTSCPSLFCGGPNDTTST